MKGNFFVGAFLAAFSFLALDISASAQDSTPNSRTVAPSEAPVQASPPTPISGSATGQASAGEPAIPTATPTRSPAEDWRYSQEIAAFMSETNSKNAKRRDLMLKAWKARGSLFADLFMTPKERLTILEHLGVKKWFPAFRSAANSSPSLQWDYVVVRLLQVNAKKNGISMKVLIANTEFASLFAAGLVKEAAKATPPGLEITKQEPIILPSDVKGTIYTLPDSGQELHIQLPQWSFIQVMAEPGVKRETLVAFANQLRVVDLVEFLWPKEQFRR